MELVKYKYLEKKDDPLEALKTAKLQKNYILSLIESEG
jgi:hypothetical protein